MQKKKRFTYKAVLRGLLPYIIFVLVFVTLINVEMAYSISVVAEQERELGAGRVEEYIEALGLLQDEGGAFSGEHDLRTFLEMQRQCFESGLYHVFVLTNLLALLSGGP